MQRRPRRPDRTDPTSAIRVERPFELGSAEWVSLPDLGLPAVHAKIDTGARTSALHAGKIEIYEAAAGARVRFVVYPIAGSRDTAQNCDAALVGRRWVISSNGERELRCVVATTLAVGGRRWPIEITLTDRGRMRYRMLLGRRAILGDMIVVPTRAGLQPVIGNDIRGKAAAGGARDVIAATSLRIGLIGDGPFGSSWQGIADAALSRGHVVERIDIARSRLIREAGRPRIECDGRRLPPLDAVMTLGRPSASGYLLAVMRQAELAGAAGLNRADVLARALDHAGNLQALWSAGLATVREVITANDEAPGQASSPPRGRRVSGLVVDGKVAALVRTGATDTDTPSKAPSAPTERRLMIRAAAALELGLARVDLALSRSGALAVAGVDAAPLLDKTWREARTDPLRAVVIALERRAAA